MVTEERASTEKIQTKRWAYGSKWEVPQMPGLSARQMWQEGRRLGPHRVALNEVEGFLYLVVVELLFFFYQLLLVLFYPLLLFLFLPQNLFFYFLLQVFLVLTLLIFVFRLIFVELQIFLLLLVLHVLVPLLIYKPRVRL